MAHRKLGWTAYMMLVSITSLTHAIKVRWWPRHRGLPMQISGQNEKHENFVSGHGIELDFFSQLQNYMPHPREPELAKVDPWRFS